jgi:hypothetical protein
VSVPGGPAQGEHATETARIWLREDGIVIARVHPGARQTVTQARENLRAAIAAREGVRRPILVDISGCEPLRPEVRKCYTGPRLSSSFTAIALVVEPTSFGLMIGNIYLQIASPGIPARLFPRERDAIAWLHGRARVGA